MSLNVIISHYNAFEYKDFIQFVENNSKLNSSFIVYNKSNKLIEFNSSNVKVVSLPNIGREGETYLNHIISNYENLNDYTLFNILIYFKLHLYNQLIFKLWFY